MKYCVNKTIFDEIGKILKLETLLVNSDLDDALQYLVDLRYYYTMYGKLLATVEENVENKSLTVIFNKSKSKVVWEIGEDFITTIGCLKRNCMNMPVIKIKL